jgi:hypothetical protein
MINKLINNLPKRCQWLPHNLIAHPLMEIFYQLGFNNLSEKIHDVTIPEKDIHESNNME